MPSPKLISILLIATFPVCVSFNQARAAQDRNDSVAVSAVQAEIPDETRIAADLKTYPRFASISVLGMRPGSDEKVGWTTIRSSVRKGEVLKFRVTSLYRAAMQSGPQREVDSIVSYRVHGGHWSLLDVHTTGIREVPPNGSDSAVEGC